MRAFLIIGLLASLGTTATAQDTTSRGDTILDVNKPSSVDMNAWKAAQDSHRMKSLEPVIFDKYCLDSVPPDQPQSCASATVVHRPAPLKEVLSRTLVAFAADGLVAEIRHSSANSVSVVVPPQPPNAQCLSRLAIEPRDIAVAGLTTEFDTFLAPVYSPIALLPDSSVSSIRILVQIDAASKGQGSGVWAIVVAYAPRSGAAPPLRIAACYMTHVLAALRPS